MPERCPRPTRPVKRDREFGLEPAHEVPESPSTHRSGGALPASFTRQSKSWMNEMEIGEGSREIENLIW